MTDSISPPVGGHVPGRAMPEGASDKSDRAVVNGAASVSALRASVPSAVLFGMADRVQALPHMSRPLNNEIGSLFGEQFNYNFLGYIDAANRLAIDGYSWCAGVTIDDEGVTKHWANVHSGDPYERGERIDVSVEAASECIALTAAWLRAQAIEARRAETQGGSVHESPVGNADAPEQGSKTTGVHPHE